MAYDPSSLRVLTCFTNTDTLGFTEIADMLQFETDLAGYYLRKLQTSGLIEKIDRGKYQITPQGKSTLAHARQFTNKIATPRISIMLVASFRNTLIVVKRAKQPFLGRVEWPTLPLVSEESMPEAAKQLAKLRLGIDTQPVLKGIFRRTDIHQDEVFDDKFFAVHTIELDEAQISELLESSETGTLLQIDSSELHELENRAKSLLDILEFCTKGDSYHEERYELSNSDLYELKP